MIEKYTEEQINLFKQLQTLMDMRVDQFKELYEHNWYSMLLKDELYSDLCKRYALVKMSNLNPTYELSEEEKKNLILKLDMGTVTPEEFMAKQSE